MTLQEHALRKAAFLAWDRKTLIDPIVAPILGSGRYGTVVDCCPGWPGCAAKVIMAKSWRARREAYREHVVGLLQSLLLLERVTPHFPWHYAAELTTTAPPDLQLSVVLFMERYPSSLLQGAQEFLSKPDTWATLLFQLSHAATALAVIFGVVQNDTYPRNALVRPLTSSRIVYDVDGCRYSVRADFLAVLTDYGISSGDLVAAPVVPEVAFGKASDSRLTANPVPAIRGQFAFLRPTAHVLAYRDLPVYARDISMLFKWPMLVDSAPKAPLSVHLWSLAALHRLDRAAASLDTSAGLLKVFHEVFAPAFLKLYQLRSVTEAPIRATADYVLRPDARSFLLDRANQALIQAREDEASWAAAVEVGEAA